MNSRSIHRPLLILVVLLSVLGGAFVIADAPAVALAQAPTPSDDQVNRIAKQLYCPVCENTPLDVCPTEACRQWRDLIREKLSLGWTEAQIQQYFVEQYGARVLAEPPRTGFNWLYYILPALVILAGILLFAQSLRGWRAARTEPGAQQSPDDRQPPDEYLARLEDELRRRS